MAVLETLSAGVSLISGLVSAARSINSSVTGYTVARNVDRIAASLERLENRLYYLQRQEVWDTGVSAQHRISNLKDISLAARPIQQTLGMDLIVSTPIITPNRLLSALETNPEHILFDIKPLNSVSIFQCASDPTLIPVVFSRWGQLSIGLIKLGYARDYLNFNYTPQSSLLLSSFYQGQSNSGMQSNLTSTPPIHPNHNLTGASLTPESITKAIKAVPLLQQSDLAKSFEGRHVSWKGTINLAQRSQDNKITVILTCESIGVSCDVTPQSHYILNSIRAGDKVIVTGKIRRANIYSIHLSDVSVSIAF